MLLTLKLAPVQPHLATIWLVMTGAATQSSNIINDGEIREQRVESVDGTADDLEQRVN